VEAMSELEGRSIETSRTSRDAFEYTQANGLDFRFPLANELFVDLDDEASKMEFDRNYLILVEVFDFREAIFTPSRRKSRGIHVVVTMGRDVTPIERIALQAALGSDPTREAHSLVRYAAKDPLPTLFFEKKQ
jgi:hypothetical protein